MKKLFVITIIIAALLTWNTDALAETSLSSTNTGGSNAASVNLIGINPTGGGVGGSTDKTGLLTAADNGKFMDISGHWAEEAIVKIADPLLFAGKDGRFQPDRPIARYEFVMMLHKALDIRIMYFKATDIGEFYKDVKNEDSYASALYDLATAGIMDYKGLFRPESTMTREEMVHYLLNAYKYKMGDSFKQIKLSAIPFADNDRITVKYRGEIARAEHDGLIKRPAGSRFYPRDPATRAQAATVLYRLQALLEREASQVEVIPSAEIKGGILAMKLSITNHSIQTVVINHTSGQKYDFELLDAGGKAIYRWSADKMFPMMLTETSIGPGKTAEFGEDVPKEVFDGIQGKAVTMKAYIAGTSNAFPINQNGYAAAVKEAIPK